AKTHAKHGTTAMCPASVAASSDELTVVAKGFKEAVAKGTDGAKILGWHVEGPYMNLDTLGAHKAEYVRAASVAEMKQLYEDSGRNIRVVTLAPEVEGALDVIRYLNSIGVIATMGHSTATVEEFDRGVAAGAKHTTHLFNAMRKFHHREPGIIGAALVDDRVSSEVIADGIHVHPTALKLFYKCKGPDKAILVTDSIESVDLPDGQYKLGSLKVFVENGSARLEDGTLAGSTLTMDKAVKNIINLAGASLEDASRMASLNPAKLLRIDYRKGSIALSKDADLVAIDDDFNVKLTIVEGKIVYNNLN
ncbi:MAG: N-acetylglucosamine-6-phosphate deacetylase, partial [Firmicutes bacterium]|nr:N-acetylglucosamine-6-phosphate deacetylase [Bacillota bacterium]